MSQFLRILLAVLTLLTALAMLGFAVWALTMPQIGMAIVCFLLAGGFGIFVYHDYQYFFGKKNDTTTKTQV